MDKASLIQIATKTLYDTAADGQPRRTQVDAACDAIRLLRPLVAPALIKVHAEIDDTVNSYVASRNDYQYADDDLSLLFSAFMPYAFFLLESAHEGKVKFIFL